MSIIDFNSAVSNMIMARPTVFLLLSTHSTFVIPLVSLCVSVIFIKYCCTMFSYLFRYSFSWKKGTQLYMEYNDTERQHSTVTTVSIVYSGYYNFFVLFCTFLNWLNYFIFCWFVFLFKSFIVFFLSLSPFFHLEL